MKEKPTIIDIAKSSGFSKSTVSKVLRNEPYVKQSTKEKILSVINRFGYQPDEIARSLVLRKTVNLIGLIISDITNPFFSEVVLGIEAEAKKKNCNVILCNTNYIIEEEKKYIDILIRNRALGILLCTPTMDDKNIQKLLDMKYPFVLVTRKVEGIEANRVAVNYYDSAKEAVQYLLRKGHKNIAHFTSFENIYGIIRRLEGYVAALKENGIKVEEEFISKSKISIEGGFESAKKIINIKNRPTAIFAADDLLAIGAMEFFLENGYKIPQDFSIVGYDNIKMSSLKSINLTTIDQPKFEMGKKAVEILFHQIEGGSDFKQLKCILPTKLIERESVLDLNV